MDTFGVGGIGHRSQPQTTFKLLRRFHHQQNLDSRGLNDLSEAFQNFLTRAKFFSLGRLRRTWSHSAVEFMKYRRLLPMIVGDEQEPGSAFDDFLDFNSLGLDGLPLPSAAARMDPKTDERRIFVDNVSARATKNQLQSFFGKFGKVQSSHIPVDRNKLDVGIYATLGKNPRHKWHGTCVITFKAVQSAINAKKASADDLVFYGQQMRVRPYISTSNRRRTTSAQTDQEASHGKSEGVPMAILSRTSSNSSLASNATSCSSMTVGNTSGMPLDDLPDRALVLVLIFVGPLDRIRFERVNKRWLELAAKAWTFCCRLDFGKDLHLVRRFSQNRPLCQTHLRAILRRCGPHILSLSLAGSHQLLDEQSIREIASICTNLTELDMSGVVASPDSLRALTESTPHLVKIAYREMTNSTERAFWFLFRAVANQIQSVDLRECRRLRGTFFKLFGSAMEEIFLDGCVLLDDRTVEDICFRCQCLHALRLDCCSKLTDQALSLISRHLSALELLSLRGDFPNFSAIGIAQIGRIASLRTLNLDYNPLVDDQLILTLVQGLPLLRHFSLAFAGSDKSISSTGLTELANLNELLGLDLSGLAAVNKDVLGMICKGCQKLQKLMLKSCIYLEDEGAVQIEQLDKLEHVDLSGCILISNKAVQQICNSCRDNRFQASPSLCLVIGGTICEPHKIRCPRDSRVILDSSDNSGLDIHLNMTSAGDDGLGEEEDEDEFRILSAHRDFIADALQMEDEPFPDGDEQSILEWARNETSEMARSQLELGGPLTD